MNNALYSIIFLIGIFIISLLVESKIKLRHKVLYNKIINLEKELDKKLFVGGKILKSKKTTRYVIKFLETNKYNNLEIFYDEDLRKSTMFLFFNKSYDKFKTSKSLKYRKKEKIFIHEKEEGVIYSIDTNYGKFKVFNNVENRTDEIFIRNPFEDKLYFLSGESENELMSEEEFFNWIKNIDKRMNKYLKGMLNINDLKKMANKKIFKSFKFNLTISFIVTALIILIIN